MFSFGLMHERRRHVFQFLFLSASHYFCLSFCLPSWLSPSVGPYFWLHVICLSVFLSVCLRVCPVCRSFFPSCFLSVSLPFCQSIFHTCLSVYHTVCLPVCRYITLFFILSVLRAPHPSSCSPFFWSIGTPRKGWFCKKSENMNFSVFGWHYQGASLLGNPMFLFMLISVCIFDSFLVYLCFKDKIHLSEWWKHLPLKEKSIISQCMTDNLINTCS